MLWSQESHGEQCELGLDDAGLAFLFHQRATALGVGQPFYLLHLDSLQLTVGSDELEGVDVPQPRASFLVA